MMTDNTNDNVMQQHMMEPKANGLLDTTTTTTSSPSVSPTSSQSSISSTSQLPPLQSMKDNDGNHDGTMSKPAEAAETDPTVPTISLTTSSNNRRRRSVAVNPNDLAKVGLRKSSSTAGSSGQPDIIMRDTSDMDNSVSYQVGLPKKSPLHRQMQRNRRQSTDPVANNSSNVMIGRTKSSDSAEIGITATITDNTPLRRSYVDPKELAKTMMMDNSSNGLTREDDSSRSPVRGNSKPNRSPVRRRSIVAPEDLVKAGLKLKNSSRNLLLSDSAAATDNNSILVVGHTSMRDHSERMDNSQLEVAIPKKSPLFLRQVRGSRRQSTQVQQLGSNVSQTTSSVVEPNDMANAMDKFMEDDDTEDNNNGSSSSSHHSPVRSSNSRRRTSIVDPKDLVNAGVNLRSFRTQEGNNNNESGHIAALVVGPRTTSTMRDNSSMRDQSERMMDSSQLEVALPKKCPLRHQINQRQQSTTTTTGTTWNAAAEPQQQQQHNSRRTSYASESGGSSVATSSVRRVSVVNKEDLVKAGLLLRSSRHLMKDSSCRRLSAENNNNTISTTAAAAATAAVVGPMRDSSEREGCTNFEVILPKKSPLHRQQQQQRRFSSATMHSNSSSTQNTSSQVVRRSTVTFEDLRKAGLLSRSSHHSAMTAPSIAEDSGHNTQATIEEGEELMMEDDAAAATDETPRGMSASCQEHHHQPLIVGLRRSSVGGSSPSKVGLRISHSSVPTRSKTAPALPSKATTTKKSSASSTTVEDDAKIKAGLRRHSSMGAPTTTTNTASSSTTSSTVDNDARIKAGLRASRMGGAAASSSNTTTTGGSSTVDNDARIKAGLRATRMGSIMETTAPGGPLYVGAPAPATSSPTPATSNSASMDQISRDARIKAGLRNSSGTTAGATPGSALYVGAPSPSTTPAASANATDQISRDARIKAGLRNSIAVSCPAPTPGAALYVGAPSPSPSTTPATSSTATDQISRDARIKAGLRSSIATTAMATPGAALYVGAPSPSPSATPAASASTDQITRDARTKAGLRNFSGTMAVTTPGAALYVGAPASSSTVASSASPDQISRDARTKAGLRSSIAVSCPTPTTSSDLSSLNDARTKAGLRNSTICPSSAFGLRSARFGLSPAISGVSTLTDVSALTDYDFQNSTHDTVSLFESSLHQEGPAANGNSNHRVSVGIPSPDGSASPTSMADEFTPQPGAFRASMVQVGEEQMPLALERVDSLEGGGMDLLGSTDFQPPRSDHLSAVSSAVSSVDLDLEAQTTRDLLTADVEPIHESPKEDNEGKGSRQKLLFCAILAGILVVAIVGVVIGVVIGGKSQDSSSTSSSTSTPSNQQQQDDTMTLESVFGDFVADLPAETIVAIQYGKAGDPQVKAFEWITKDPNLEKYSIPQRKQRMALASFFYGTNGNRWFKKEVQVANPWLDYDSHECMWFSHASLLELSVCDTMGLEGPLPQFEHFEFTSLVLTGREVVTHDTGTPNPRLSGALIPELAMLSSLRRLDVSTNKLRGSIPNSIEPWLSSLEEIVLFDNELTGTIPPSLFANSRKLWLGLNNFERSAMPATIGSELTSLSLTETNTGGTIPPQLFTPNLRELFLSKNNIEGSIPSEIGTASLTVLELNQNEISSSLPTELGLLTDLQVIRVFGNSLTGSLPSEMGRLSALEELMVSTFGYANNDLEGTIPSGWWVRSSEENDEEGLNETSSSKVLRRPAFPEMKHLMLEDTHLSGSIPAQIGLMTSMVGLYMGWNQMSSVLPSEVGLMSNLEIMSLTDSTLHSEIPSQVGLLSSLVRLELQANNLSGNFPSELGLLAETLTEFNVDENILLGGTIPNSFCDIEQLAFSCDNLCGCDCPCN